MAQNAQLPTATPDPVRSPAHALTDAAITLLNRAVVPVQPGAFPVRCEMCGLEGDAHTETCAVPHLEKWLASADDPDYVYLRQEGI